MFSLSFVVGAICLIASCFLAVVAADSTYVTVEELQKAPDGWLQGPEAPPSKLMRFHIAVRQEKAAEFEQMVLDMSTPGHHDYGRHMNRDDVRAFVRPANHTMEQVLSWLDSEDVPAESIESHGNWVEVTMPVSHAQSLLKAKFHRYSHRRTHKHAIRTLSYSVPRDIHPFIQLIQPTTRFGQPAAQVMRPTFQPIAATFDALTADCSSTVTPDCLRKLYGLYDTNAKPDPRNRLGISGYLDQYARYSDFHQFMRTYAPNRTDTNFTVVSINGGLNLQDSPLGSSEASMDIQYAISLAYSPLATYYTTAGRAPFIPEVGETGEDESSNEPYLEQLHYLLNLSDEEIPAILTTSYGEDEQSVPESYSEATCNLLAQLGARGVSVIFSSGDDGVGSSCLANDGTNKTRFQPIFPASCPFVTSVGGTYGTNPEKAIDFSGGGFSDRFPRPPYQNASVGSYLGKIGNTFDGLYNSHGRGIPDVAAQANNYLVIDHGVTYRIGGTSASAPVFAAIVSRLNAARLKDGKSRLGFLNPWLYSLNQTGFTDIVDGRSVGCLGGIGVEVPYASWNATPGWDPVTGLGTPFYNTLVKLAVFLRRLRSIIRPLVIIAFLLVVCQFAYTLHYQSPEFAWEKNAAPPRPNHAGKPLRPGSPSKWDVSLSPPDCQTFSASPFAEDGIQVTLKIGGAETQERIRSHVDGVTTCIPNLLVVSDMGQKLGPFHSHDILADVIHVLSDEDKRTYQRQREYHYYWDKELQPTQAGWRLDRYKFLSMVEYAYAQNPNAKWYVFFETDTLMLWDNLAQLLARFDHTEPLYLGSPTPGRALGTRWEPQATFFAYGGSGLVLSVAAMENLLREDRAGSAQGGSEEDSQLLITKYQDMVREDCCGDSVLGWVAAQRDVKIMGQWPMFNPLPLHGTPLGKAYWCQPAISFHKSDPVASVDLWNWQQTRPSLGGDLQRPLLYSDVVDFFDFASVPIRENWNNADVDAFDAPQEGAHDSFDFCKIACHQHADCLQYTYHQKKCHLVRVIRLGNPARPDGPDTSEDGRWMAGWDVEKIQEFKNSHACENVDWPEPSTERIF
ncbi:peptidase S8/S53 domain-containing protein [Aspergillus cavernicola]|uniref:tripeptidyl-peptidase II n=1 Tax=Aspergillus cavernicola TaxID=176166 RepID=A0ABR4J4T2_9EURO